LLTAVTTYDPPVRGSVSEPGRTTVQVRVPAGQQVPVGQLPRHAKYVDLTARVRSFDGSVVPDGQDVHELATAGFFHVGK